MPASTGFRALRYHRAEADVPVTGPDWLHFIGEDVAVDDLRNHYPHQPHLPT